MSAEPALTPKQQRVLVAALTERIAALEDQVRALTAIREEQARAPLYEGSIENARVKRAISALALAAPRVRNHRIARHCGAALEDLRALLPKPRLP